MWGFGDNRFPVSLPQASGAVETTEGKSFPSSQARFEAFDQLWQAAAWQPLTDAIDGKDAAAMAGLFHRIDALIEDRQGQSSTFCFSVLELGKSLMAQAQRYRSRLLLNKARLYLMRSDDLGPGDLSHRALHDEMTGLLKDLAALRSDNWR